MPPSLFPGRDNGPEPHDDMPADWAESLRTIGANPRPIGANLWRVFVDGHEAVAKAGPGVADEAEGLRRISLVDGAPPVPQVLHEQEGLLITEWVEEVSATASHEIALGRGLAALHAPSWSEWGGGSSWIGRCRVAPEPTGDGATYYGRRLVELARRCGLEAPATDLAARLDLLLPPGPPALVHGDLWWGNVLWGQDGRPWLIDPSVHGGYAEEDLAMLALFGAVPTRAIDAYLEGSGLADGWQERVGLFQLYPLLVHTVLFGGSYRVEAEAIMSRFV